MRVMLFLFSPLMLLGQESFISGIVSFQGKAVPYANVQLENTNYGSVTDSSGYFIFNRLPEGTYTLLVSHIGFDLFKETIIVDGQNKQVTIELRESRNDLEDIVVTGTRTEKLQSQSPVMVNTMNRITLNAVQACNLSDGLRFQPGLRVESNCQTCNYSQLRINGLGGGYSQILINGRPIFSPLIALYGLEQIPASMVERIEVVRGGGSALYGSSSIGGTVNVITRRSKENEVGADYTYQQVGDSPDHQSNAMASVIFKEGAGSVFLYAHARDRSFYDHNSDGFSELPMLKNRAFGGNLNFEPAPNQKFQVGFSLLNEYRLGGDMSGKPVYLLEQAEEREHQIMFLDANYEITIKKTSITVFAGSQQTDRLHYTGILPDDSTSMAEHLIDPPYGTSDNRTHQVGIQIDHSLERFPLGYMLLSGGVEWMNDIVLDEIESYSYKIDQNITNTGFFVQSDWSISEKLTLLSGLRSDFNSKLDEAVFNPRLAAMYRLKKNLQFRLSWGTGFRAPQAFDADMHIAFAGGGVSRIYLSPDLRSEHSSSWSTSVNYDRPSEHIIYGITFEAFHTKLQDAFYLYEAGADMHGMIFEKRNGLSAEVKGMTIELRTNVDGRHQIEGGLTWQSSEYQEAIEYINGLPGERDFLRTPNIYGFASLSSRLMENWETTLNALYTGSMKIAHFAGAPEQKVDEYINSPHFIEISFKTAYTFDLTSKLVLEVFGGIKNMGNAYQNDFDSGKNRDSNYIYGPLAPRTFFIGIKGRIK